MPAGRLGLRRRAVVDLTAIVENALSLRELDTLGADLRANAYGHGIVSVASALRHADIRHVIVSNEADREELIHTGHPAKDVSLASHDFDETGTGLGIYGLGDSAASRSTLRLSGEVVSVKQVPAGSGVSYGYTYRTTAQSTLALVALGFADGIPRSASNRAPVQIGSFRGRVTGRVAMDQFVVDLGDSIVELGDDAVLFGDAEHGEPTLREWADATGLAPERILSAIGTRVERRYLDERSGT